MSKEIFIKVYFIHITKIQDQSTTSTKIMVEIWMKERVHLAICSTSGQQHFYDNQRNSQPSPTSVKQIT